MWSSWSKNNPLVVSHHENLCILVHARLSLWLSAHVSVLSHPEFYKSCGVIDSRWGFKSQFNLLDHLKCKYLKVIHRTFLFCN